MHCVYCYTLDFTRHRTGWRPHRRLLQAIRVRLGALLAMDAAVVHTHDDLWMLYFLGAAQWVHPSEQAIRGFQVGTVVDRDNTSSSSTECVSVEFRIGI